MDKISVIVPCYNVAHLVPRCIDSILNQSIGMDNIEIILVDDASTDNTVEVLKKYEQRFPQNIILITCDTNRRQGTARNIGLSYASGTYISFVDSDDIIHKDMYRTLLEIALKQNCDIVQFRYKGVNGNCDNTDCDITKNLSYQNYQIDSPIARRKLLINDNILNQSCTTKFYKKELLDRAHVAFAEGVAYEEPLFTYPLKMYVNKVAVTETPLYYYVYNDAGTTASYMSDISTINQHLEVQLATFHTVQQHADYHNYRQEIELYFMHTFYAETFYFLHHRSMCMPLTLFRQMATTIENLVPDYLKNPYLNDPSMSLDKALLNLIPRFKNADDATTQSALDNIIPLLF